jgi:hypothetical protein
VEYKSFKGFFKNYRKKLELKKQTELTIYWQLSLQIFIPIQEVKRATVK